MWSEKCDRKIDVPLKKLYTNYKVCSDHFTSSMFLNDLKNRLQAHAIPVSKNDECVELSSGNKTIFNLNNDENILSGISTLNSLEEKIYRI